MREKDGLDKFNILRNRFDFTLELAAQDEEHYKQMRKLLLSFIEVRDSLDRLLSATGDVIDDGRNEVEAGERQDSLRLIARQFDKALEAGGVTPISCLHQQVEPGKHTIIAAEEDSEMAEDTIIHESLRGYEWNGEILRKPHVIVARNAVPTDMEK